MTNAAKPTPDFHPEGGAKLPSTTGVLGAITTSAGDYLAVMDRANNAMNDLSKSLSLPPQGFSWIRANTMSDVSGHNLMPWPGLSPTQLRRLSQENLAPKLILQQRRADIIQYSSLASHPWKAGWRIALRNARETPSKAALSDMREAERFILNCNFEESDPRTRDAKLISPWQEFLLRLIEDIELFDAVAIWTDMDRQDRIRAFTALPAEQIRLANPSTGYQGDPRLFAALVDNTLSPVTGLSREELIWRVMSPRGDPVAYGYGQPIMEQAIVAVQAFQSAIELNRNTFDKNSIPLAIMLLKGNFWTQDQLDLVTRAWTNQQLGNSKAFGVPVIGVPEEGEIELLRLNDIKGTELRYRDHMNLMLGIYCSIAQFPVKRLGMFASGGEKDNKPEKDSSLAVAGIDDVGMPSRLLFLEETINSYILWTRWAHLSLEFCNKSPVADAREYEFKKLASTWSESRALADLPKLSSRAPAHLKDVVELLELIPEDPNKAGVFQSIAAAYLKAKLEPAADGRDPAAPGARMESKTDPAISAQHGHLSGVRRDSKAEKVSAKPNGAGHG